MFVGEFSVDSGVRVDASLNIGLVLGVKVYLHDSLSVRLHSGSLANNFRGVDNVIENGILDSCQRSRTRAGSTGLLVSVVRFSQNGTLSDDNNMLPRKFLFQFTNELLLNLIHRSQKLVRDVQDNCLAASTVDLLGSCDVNASEGSLELCRSHLEVEKLVCDRLLELIRFLSEKQITLREGLLCTCTAKQRDHFRRGKIRGRHSRYSASSLFDVSHHITYTAGLLDLLDAHC